jgi:hypothetical protein
MTLEIQRRLEGHEAIKAAELHALQLDMLKTKNDAETIAPSLCHVEGCFSLGHTDESNRTLCDTHLAMAINGSPARIEGSGTYGIQSERCMYGKCPKSSSATIQYFPGGPLINYCSNRCRKLHHLWDKDHYNLHLRR